MMTEWQIRARNRLAGVTREIGTDPETLLVLYDLRARCTLVRLGRAPEGETEIEVEEMFSLYDVRKGARVVLDADKETFLAILAMEMEKRRGSI